MLINLDNQIVVLDEAHNMEDVSRSATSLDLTNVQLQKVKDELMGLLKCPSKIVSSCRIDLYFVLSPFQSMMLN